MILPIFAYGHPILREKAKSVAFGTDVKNLTANMLLTMKNADGGGLAAPQIGKSIRLFIMDYEHYSKKKSK